MSGWLTNGFQNLAQFYGGEHIAVDTSYPGGQLPLSAKVNLLSLATAVAFFNNFTSKTTVAGTRYYGSVNVNAPNSTFADGGADQLAPVATITGIQALIGTTGGTDKFIYELHDSAGVPVATTALAGVTVGTAGTWQQIPFTATVALSPGTYFIVVQSNGTTATPAVFNFPAPVVQTTTLISGSVAGTFGTSANFTPATTYTAGLAPVASLY